jgi:hypothetical protein
MAILAASLIAAFFYLAPGIQENSTPASSSGAPDLNNYLMFTGQITFGFVGSNSTEVAAAAGSIVHGTIIVNILQEAPLRFYIDDSGYNTSSSSFPAGMSISLNMYGNNYDPVLFSKADNQSLSTIPLVPTALGETNVQYAISVASSVLKGVYDTKIVFWSFLNNGTLYDQAEEYQVTLHVQ